MSKTDSCKRWTATRYITKQPHGAVNSRYRPDEAVLHPSDIRVEHTMTHSNVDPDEIAKFEALASRWWDENSEFKPLHDINQLRA